MTIATKTPRARRLVRRLTATLSELDHAQRRLLELQTGTTGLTRTTRRSLPIPVARLSEPR
jgi:hypothetical protein